MRRSLLTNHLIWKLRTARMRRIAVLAIEWIVVALLCGALPGVLFALLLIGGG